MAMAAPADITALTLNCWGLKYISALRAERFPEIGRRIAALASADNDNPLDIVALQECWVQADFETVRRLTRHVLPHAKFFHSGVWGSGLAVLSRWPIAQTSMYAYPLCGRPTAFWRGDWFVGKGIASATLTTPHGPVDVLVTHTHAPYESKLEDDSYLVHQLAQTWELGKRVRAGAERGRLVLAMGDYNMTPDNPVYRALHLGAGHGRGLHLADTWRELHPDASLGPADHPNEVARGRPVPSALFNLEHNGATSDGAYNTWRWPKDKQKRLHAAYQKHAPTAQTASSDKTATALAEFSVDPDTPDPRGKRLDYIFYAHAGPVSSHQAWRTKAACVAMVEPHPTVGCSVSDHFAYMVTLTRSDEVPAVESTGLAARATDAAHLDRFLAESDKYMLRELKQRYWRSVHFFSSVAVAIGCYVAVWFSPRPFVALLLTLLASLGLTAGTMDGLLALLFFGSEIRSLKEFHWEIAHARSQLTEIATPGPHQLSSGESDKTL